MICGGIKKASFASLATLAAITALLFNAPIITESSAYAESNKFDLRVQIAPQISLTTSTNTVSMSVLPEPNGSFVSENMTAVVSTNNATGYTLLMSTKGSNANLVETSNSERVITSNFVGTVTSSTMPNGSWGYSLDGTNFSAVPLAANAVQINSSNAPVNNSSSTVTYGAKLDSSTVAGTYEDVVVFTTFVNSDYVPDGERTIFDITYMQQMTPLVCSNTQTPLASATDTIWNKTDDENYVPRTALIDSRDGTLYIISKLADGKCWMSQNLELELDNEPLTSDDTDLNTKSSWTSANYTREYDDTTPWVTHTWDDDPGVGYERSIMPTASVKYLRGGLTPAATATNTYSSYSWERTGYYYNWTTAGAGSDSSDSSNSNSICPKGWTLPTTTQFTSLISTYNLSSNPEKAKSSPLNLTFSGTVSNWGPTGRAISNQGGSDGQAIYWAGNSKSGLYVSNSWGDAQVSSFYYDDGHTIRCIAK